jgi:hypothetical protein
MTAWKKMTNWEKDTARREDEDREKAGGWAASKGAATAEKRPRNTAKIEKMRGSSIRFGALEVKKHDDGTHSVHHRGTEVDKGLNAEQAAAHVSRHFATKQGEPSAPRSPGSSGDEGEGHRPGLEGPFNYRSGWSGYYDPKEAATTTTSATRHAARLQPGHRRDERA